MVADGEVVIEVRIVGDVAEVLAGGHRFLLVVDGEAGDPDPALGGLLQAADQLGRGGLAAAVGSHEGDALAGRDGEVERLQGRHLAVVAAEVVGLEQDCRAGTRLLTPDRFRILAAITRPIQVTARSGGVGRTVGEDSRVWR